MWLDTNVSGQPIGLIFQGSSIPRSFLNPWNGTMFSPYTFVSNNLTLANNPEHGTPDGVPYPKFPGTLFEKHCSDTTE
jgi:hypothetical protein